MSFTDLGIPVDAVESRTAAICTNAAGDCRVVIAAKGFLLVIDPVTGSCRQLFFPMQHSEYPYDSFSSRSGTFYVGAGTMFYAFDPFQLAYIETIEIGSEDELCGFSYAENEQGHIFMASYPESRLYRYRPIERDITSFGSMDSEQKYPSHMAADAYGWVYIGMGTTKKNIIAFHPESGDRQSLIEDEMRTIGHGQVIQAPSGQVYALLGEQWARVERGSTIEKLKDNELPASLYTGTSFGKFHRQLPGEWRVVSHSLSQRELVMEHRLSKQLKTIKLRYQSEGATLSPIALAPDGHIYGTSNHPLHFYSYNLHNQTLNNEGPTIIQHGAGGNIAAYAIQGNILAGAAYPGGRLHLFDLMKPIQLDESQQRNPVCVTEHIEIHRPRCAVALRNGMHIVYGGFPGYGMVGGGLCIYHLHSGHDQLIPHTKLIPEQSTVALAEMYDGMLIAGTSVETPGGADPKSESAYLYIFDWQNQTVLKSWQPRIGIREYALLLIDPSGRIHALSSCSHYLVWDPGSDSLIYEMDLSAWGSIVRQGWQLCTEEQCIYGVMSEAVFKIPLSSLRPERIATPPHSITAGFAEWNRELFFAISTHLWSYSMRKE